MKTFKTLSIVLLIVLLAVAIGPLQAQDGDQVVLDPGNTIKIALVTDLTGPIAPMGLDILQAAEIAVLEANEMGGIEGFEFELVVEDDGCSGDQGTTVAARVVSNPDIVAVSGHSCSGPTISASDVYEEAMIPMMSPSATATLVTARGLAVMNRVAFSDGAQGTVDAHYLYKILGVRNLAVLHDNDAYGLGLAEVVRDEFEALSGEDVVAFQGIDVTSQDYRGVLGPLVAEEPDAIFFGGYQEQAILLVTQMQDVGLDDVIFMGPDGMFAQAFIDGAGDAAEGVFASFVEEAEVSEAANEAFDDKYEELYGVRPEEQGPFHAQSYDATSILIQAIEAVAEVNDEGQLVIDRTALVEEVRNTAGYEGLSGTLSCDEKGDCGAGSIGINVVEDGEWVDIEVPEDLLEMEVE